MPSARQDAGFDGIELNYDLETTSRPKSSARPVAGNPQEAEQIGIAISGLCSFLYWPYSLDRQRSRSRRPGGLELARLMIEAAHELGTENLLTIAGSTYIPWIPDRDPVRNRRLRPQAREAIGQLCRWPKSVESSLNIENIWFNGYLTTPDEMNAFVDTSGASTSRFISTRATSCSSSSPNTGFRSWAGGSRMSTSRSSPRRGPTTALDSFRTLLDGTTNWPAVMDALEQAGYEGY